MGCRHRRWSSCTCSHSNQVDSRYYSHKAGWSRLLPCTRSPGGCSWACNSCRRLLMCPNTSRSLRSIAKAYRFCRWCPEGIQCCSRLLERCRHSSGGCSQLHRRCTALKGCRSRLHTSGRKLRLLPAIRSTRQQGPKVKRAAG